MKTVSVIGLGNRGTGYMRILKLRHKDFKINALCDIKQSALDEIAPKYGVGREMQFGCTEDFFKKGVLSDALIISTQDKSHFEIAMAAIDCGYKFILLEKPVSGSITECEMLRDAAEKNGVKLIVCHVMRYSNIYRAVKKIIRSGEIGDVVSINHTENVAYFHFAHSYVRGNWKREEDSTPSILAKCCHDLDLIPWLMDKKVTSVASMGGLNYFNAAHAPGGATKRCLDGCKCKGSCPYDAEATYITNPFWKARFVKYMPRTITGVANATKQMKYDALKNDDYGCCVFLNDNDVCDQQVVTLGFEGGSTAVIQMNAFSNKMFRETHVMGTQGEIVVCGEKVTACRFGKKPHRVGTGFLKLPGHLEGDVRAVDSFASLVKGEETDARDLTFIDATLLSHRIGVLAEESRKNSGKRIEYECKEK